MGKVTPSAIRGVVTSSKIGIPMATAPPNPAFDIAVVKAAQKASARNRAGLVTSRDAVSDAKVILSDRR